MPKHRGHGEGSVVQRPNGRWQAQISVSGKRLSYTADTKRAAQKWIRETLTKADQGMLPVDAGKITVADYLAQWLDAIAPSIKPKTLQIYEYAVRAHLSPVLGRFRLTNLRADHLQAMYAQKLQSGLSPRTVQILHRVLHKAMSDAERWGLAGRNVTDAVVAPRPRRQEIKTWTTEEARRFLDGAAETRLKAPYFLAIYCGLRVGELLGLRWEDLDLDGGKLQIRRTLQRLNAGKGIEVGEPKSNSGRRQIVVPSPVIEAIRRWRLHQKEDRLLAGKRWQDTGYLFTSSVGTPIEPRNFHRDFVSQTEALGLPVIRVHDLRHTCATMLLSQGVHPKIVQELLGHSQISLTMDTYSHVLPTMQAEAARTMERVLSVN